MRRVVFLLTLPLVAGPPDIIQAIRNNDLRAIQQIAPGSNEANTPIDRGTTPLMYAAGFGSLEAMRQLIEKGADVNAKNAFNATALMWAIANPAKVKLLIDKGADVNARAKSGATPLLLAALQDGTEPVVKMLLAKGADLKAKDAGGNTVLLSATSADNTAVAKLAIEAGLDVNGSDIEGATPLMNAASCGNTELVKLLIARGADVNAVSSKPTHPVKKGIVQIGSFTALMMAAPKGPVSSVKLLLEAGARVDAKDARGMTPLHFAVSSEAQDARIVRMLLNKGSDPSVKMETGETPVDWAMKFGNPETIGLFNAAKAHRVPVKVPEIEAVVNQTLDARTAAEKSVALLQKTSVSFFMEGGCPSCHAQEITAMAVEVGRQHGIHVDEDAAKGQIPVLKGRWIKTMDSLILRQDPPGGADTLNYAMFGLAAAGHKPDSMTDAMAHNLAAMQSADGGWHGDFLARVPIEDSNFTKTAMSIRSLRIYGTAGLQSEYSERIARAAKWLETHTPLWTEERTMQLLGLKWAGANSRAVDELARTLIGEQRPDGGWAQNPYLESDAYATGQALYTLNQGAGLAASELAYQRGITYLLKTQHADGSWHVQSRAVKFQPYFQSGFPYDHDQWISSQATGWAAMALSIAVPPAVKPAD